MIHRALVRHRCRSAFTVVEILIVTTLVLVLAGAVLTQVGNSIQEAKESALESDLDTLRKAIIVYKLDHEGRVPQWVAGRLPQLFAPTDHRGNIGPDDDQHPFGPYLVGNELPINPITDSNVVTQIATKRPTAYHKTGWLYHQPSGRIMADRRPTDLDKLAEEPDPGL